MLILFLFLFNFASASFKLSLKQELRNYTELSIGGDRELRLDLLDFKLAYRSPQVKGHFRFNFEYMEPYVRYSSFPINFGVNTYILSKFSFLKFYVGPYKNDSFFRTDTHDNILYISLPHYTLNLAVLVGSEFKIKENVNLHFDFGFQKTNLNTLRMIVYKFSLQVIDRTPFHFLKMKINLGKEDLFQTVRPLNFHDKADFLDAFRIGDILSREDIFNVTISERLKLLKNFNRLDLEFIGCFFYKRDQHSINSASLVFTLIFHNKNYISKYLYLYNSLRVDLQHVFHNQENQIRYDLRISLNFDWAK